MNLWLHSEIQIKGPEKGGIYKPHWMLLESLQVSFALKNEHCGHFVSSESMGSVQQEYKNTPTALTRASVIDTICGVMEPQEEPFLQWAVVCPCSRSWSYINIWIFQTLCFSGIGTFIEITACLPTNLISPDAGQRDCVGSH